MEGMNQELAMRWVPDLPDFRDYTLDHEKIKPMLDNIRMGEPEKVSLPSSTDLKARCSPIENQLSLGSCTTHAGVGLVKYGNFLRFEDEVKKIITALNETGKWEYTALKKDDTTFNAYGLATIIIDKSGNILGYQSEVLDITKLKEAEAELLLKDLVFEHSITANTISDNAGIITHVNDTFIRLWGYESRKEVIGKPISNFLRFEDEAKKIITALDETGKWEGEYTALKKDDTTFNAYGLATIIIDKSGNILGRQSAVLDITKLKQAKMEKEKLRVQLTQAQKMESIAQLAGGMAHDFNNMLSVILGYVEIALDQADQAQSFFEDLQEIRTAALRSADLTRQLLAFARKQTVAPRVMDINETIEGMLKMLRRLIGEDIDSAWLPGSGVWLIKVDPSQIDQILANLCVNARDAIEGVGKITIETENVTFDDAYCADHAGFVSGEYVLLTVSDNGCGMDKETLDKIYEPFFTTKEMGKGTGLGLSTVYGIVKQNNGFINVYSEHGHGTTIKIYLPRHAAKATQMQKEVPKKPPKRGHETILLVEDEQAILKMTTMMLERQGYTVLAVSTPGEAIRLTEAYSSEIHLLLTDVVMPEMNGRDLARNLHSFYPNLKRLFMSGYTANVIAHHGVLDEGVQFIQKPFLIEGLAAKVREALDSE